MEYVWNEGIESISIYNVLISIPKCKSKQEFKAWCFDREYKYNDKIVSASLNGGSLLKELHKPERKAWLDFAIEHGYVKKVQTYKTVWVNMYLNKKQISIQSCCYYESEIEASKQVIINSPKIKYLKTITLEIPEE